MPAATRTAAFFDFDGTIIAGYSIVAFLKSGEAPRTRPADVARTAVSMRSRPRPDRQPRVDRTGMHEWSGRSLADLEALGERIFATELRDSIFPEIGR